MSSNVVFSAKKITGDRERYNTIKQFMKCYCTIVLQDASIWRNLVKGIWDFCNFLTTVHESILISK